MVKAFPRALSFCLPILALVPLACAGHSDEAVGSSDEAVGASTDPKTDEELDRAALAAVRPLPFRDRCAANGAGQARCFSKVRTDESGNTQTFATPQGLTPADLRAAYAIPTSTATYTIGIIDAQDNPDVDADLAVYRAQFGMPACTHANGCFIKVNQDGVEGNYPAQDPDWGGEIMLDVTMASVGCPTCKILLVEANSQNVSDLGAALNKAVEMGADVISNSYGWPEDSSGPSSDTSYYHHEGVAIFASAGDNGYGVEYPAAGYYVISVGGTTLASSTSSRGWAEAAWSGTGSGCSSITEEPPWQHHPGCAHKMVSDLSAVADPNTGVAVYDVFGSGGWTVYGGTSVASPLVASIFAVTGHTHAYGASVWKDDTTDFFDVTSGSNGSCVTQIFCNAETGYDGPTGWGTPNGTGLASWGSVSGS